MLKTTAARVRWSAFALAVLLGGAVDATGADPTTLTPYSGVTSCLHAHGIDAYMEFCKTAAADFDELAALFEGGYGVAGDPGRKWEEICTRARNNISEGKRIAFNSAVGKQLSDDALKWFRLLDKFWVNLETNGHSAFLSKLNLDIEMDHRKASIKQNQGLKKDYKEELDYLDESYGFALGLREATEAKDRKAWLKDFKKANSGKNFLEIFEDDVDWAENHTEAAAGGALQVKANMVLGNPTALGGGVKLLELCQVENEDEWFASFATARKDWGILLVHLHKTYVTTYNQWQNELAWLLKNEMFSGTDYLQGWTWSQLGPGFREIYNQIKDK